MKVVNLQSVRFEWNVRKNSSFLTPVTLTPLGGRFAPPHPPLPNPSGDTSENPPPFGRRRSHLGHEQDMPMQAFSCGKISGLVPNVQRVMPFRAGSV